ncbi:pyrolysin [Panaeolus papilionaceus]|nr:pyrolysin [Panaeolus papilionaceus]
MRNVALSALFSSLLVSVALAVVPLSAVKKTTTLSGTVPNKYIIEVEDLASIPNLKRSFTRSLDAVYSEIAARDVAFEVTKEFDVEGLFVGASLVLNDAEDAAAIANTPGIKAIRPLRIFSIPTLAKDHVITGLDDPELPPTPFSTHVMTGVDKLHREGITGKGIKIGVIDTGIDYTHPTLGGGIGPGKLVFTGYDFAGDAYDGTNEPIPDDDPQDCNGHGTHVAGTIAAQAGNPYGVLGVAPDALLSGYRVFGCDGSATEEIIVDALLRGVKDGNDILTLSLGGADGWSTSSSAVVASRIANQGIIVTIAAGNDGASGSWYSSAPGNAVDVISVASVNNIVIPLQNATVVGADRHPVTYFSPDPWPVLETLPVYAVSHDITVSNDACDPLPASTPDLANYVVVIRRGTCPFTQKIDNIAAKGAKIAFIYDNGSGFGGISVGSFRASLIQAADGEFLVKQVAAGVNVSIAFPQTGASFNYPDPAGGLMSSFSSYGPSNQLLFKPAVAAPGGNIMSTIPLNLGGFGVKSGTSMACPFVAGSAALLLQAKGKGVAARHVARDLFETTANKIQSSKNDDAPLQTLTQAGAGLVDVYRALHAETIISPGQLVLNDTANFKPLQTFTVRNTGTAVKRFKLTHVPAGTAQTVKPGSIFPALGPVPLTSAPAGVTIVPSSITLRPGQSITVAALFTSPRVDKATFPVYSGFIQVDESSGGERYHVSYLGLHGSLKDKKVVDDTDTYFGYKLPTLLDSTGSAQTAPTNYTFQGDDYPALLWRLVFGTRSLQIDVVDPNIKFTPTIAPRGLFGLAPIFTFPIFHPSKGSSFANVKIMGTLSSLSYLTRQNENSGGGNAWSVLDLTAPTFANGTVIPNGQYRFLLRALKPFGDPSRQEDYESWLSPIVGVQT